MSTYNRTLWGLLTSLVGWAAPLREPPNSLGETQPSVKSETTIFHTHTRVCVEDIGESASSDNLMRDWEWLQSTVEEIAQQQEENRAKEIRQELNRLNRASKVLSYRSVIRDRVKERYIEVDIEKRDIILNSSLDASKRDRILRDLIRGFASGWIDRLLPLIPLDRMVSFSQRWSEQKYKKNICGEMAALAFRASHPAQEKGLTLTILSEICWSIHMCLAKEVANEMDMPLQEDMHEFLLDLLLELVHPLINLWDKTASSVRNVRSREGLLPSKWAREEKTEKERLMKLKEIGVSARFNDGPNDVLWKSHIESIHVDKTSGGPPEKDTSLLSQSVLDKTSFDSIRKNLAANLVLFRPNL